MYHRSLFGVVCVICFNPSQRYKDSDIEVVRKDGIILLRNIATEVRNFLEFKINAVMVSRVTTKCFLFEITIDIKPIFF